VGFWLTVAGQDDRRLSTRSLPTEPSEEQPGQVTHRADVRLIHRRHFDNLPMQQLDTAVAEDPGVDGAVVLVERPVMGARRLDGPRSRGGHGFSRTQPGWHRRA